MRARLPPDLLDRSAPEAARLLALSYLDQIDGARERLGDALDQEALHDFRVGLRRLRSATRAYRSELTGSIGGRLRRQLRDLARATNDGRDLEVQLGWLAKQAERLGPDDAAGYYWLVGRLDARKQKTHDRAIGGVARQYEKVAGKLRKSLGILRLDLTTSPGQRPPSLREVTGGLVHDQVARVKEDLSRIRDASDADQVHRTRISLKRLRYLIEPVARGNRRAGALVRRFKEAQDLLGEHHDMHVLSSAVASLRSSLSTGSFAGLDAGLATVARLADEAANTAFERFRAAWGGEPGNRILLRAEELGRELEEPSVPSQLPTSDLTAAPAVQAPHPEGVQATEGSTVRFRGVFQ
jgi:CHAD domain-containing protein